MRGSASAATGWSSRSTAGPGREVAGQRKGYGLTIWLQDITERKKLENRERMSRQRTESLIRITQTHFPSIRDLLDYALGRP
jgi:hypothetical protein